MRLARAARAARAANCCCGWRNTEKNEHKNFKTPKQTTDKILYKFIASAQSIYPEKTERYILWDQWPIDVLYFQGEEWHHHMGSIRFLHNLKTGTEMKL